MKTTYYRHLLAGMLLLASTATMAQTLNSAYFTEDYKFRHDMNPAFGNEQGYVAFPVLGNLNIKMQGNIGVSDVLFKNPNYGLPGEKKTVTFLHPSISYDEAMKGFSDKGLKAIFNFNTTILSVGFKGFGGYNTIELNLKAMAGLSVPKSLVEFAKLAHNDDYSFDELAVRGISYSELAFGHSRDIDEQWRVGAKIKALFGAARADLDMEGMHAQLVGDTWYLEGKAKGEINMKGASFKTKEEEYKSRYTTDAMGNKVPQKYQRVDGVDVDGAGLGGFGLAVDLGGVYKINDDFTVSAALTDLGFINWNNSIVAETPGGQFRFDGFHDMAIRDAYAGDGQTFGDKGDDYQDQLADFLNLEDQGSKGSSTSMLAATFNAGVEYTLPVYRKITFGFLGQHHFNGSNFSWTEGRLSANWTPLKWLDGGINLGINSFSTSMGWILNIHPKGYNFFIGMDHLMGKHNKDFIPVNDANYNVAFGMSIAW